MQDRILGVTMSALAYCEKRHDYFVDDWLAAAILGNRALLQKKDGKRMTHATFTMGRITEVKTGCQQNLGGPFTATSKGWVLTE